MASSAARIGCARADDAPRGHRQGGLRQLIPTCFAIFALALTACSSGPRAPLADGERSYRGTDFRLERAPYGRLVLTRLTDRRPSIELGRVNYLNESYYSESLLAGSVAANLRRVSLGELERSGLFALANPRRPEMATHELELRILHFYAKADRDLLGLIPVVPSVDVEAHIAFDVLLRDIHGRRFVDRRIEGRRSTGTATVAGVESQAADLLLELLADLMDELVRGADRGVREFWADFDRPPPSSGLPELPTPPDEP